MSQLNLFVKFAALMACVMIVSVSYAEIHKWVDENGKVHYGDRAPVDKKV